MAFDHYIPSGQKLLRCGYTTGTCAALAAGGAARLLLTGNAPDILSLVTPKGWPVEVAPQACWLEGEQALCAVVKDGGDDPDCTDGMIVLARVRTCPSGISIDGGAGVGRVTRPGLDQPVGAAAINQVPREMIRRSALEACREAGYAGGLEIVIEIPGGEEIAQKTFNPHLGIQGGLSILGTSGVVEPMSERAILDTIALELRQAVLGGERRLILTPGNYGMDFLQAQGYFRLGVPTVKCSNFVGDSLDMAAREGFRQVLLVGHVGKLVKLAGGIMNTHSRYAGCRTELFCAHAALCGGDTALCRALYEAPSTDGCIALLEEAGLREPVLRSITAAIQRHLDRRAAGAFAVGAVLFSKTYGLLGITPAAEEMIHQWRNRWESSTGSAWAPETRI